MSSSHWPASLQAIIEEFAYIDDPLERFEMLFDLATKVNILPVEMWNEATRVHGCQSEAHVHLQYTENGLQLQGAADAQIVQGLIAITTAAVTGLEPSEVVTMSPSFIHDLGLAQTLTPSRSNGFLNMFEKIRELAKEIEVEQTHSSA